MDDLEALIAETRDWAHVCEFGPWPANDAVTYRTMTRILPTLADALEQCRDDLAAKVRELETQLADAQTERQHWTERAKAALDSEPGEQRIAACYELALALEATDAVALAAPPPGVAARGEDESR